MTSLTRVSCAGGHPRKVRPAPQHLGWRRPVRPLALVPDVREPGLDKAGPSDPDPIPERLEAARPRGWE
jgi:hypothetical protein